MKKQIGIVATSQVTGLYMQKQLEKFLGAYVTTCPWLTSVSQVPPKQLAKSDIIIFSNKILRQDVHEYMPPGIKTIVAERTLNIENIYKILGLKKGQKVLVVATTEETAINTINIFKKLGITYLSTRPYWPGCSVDARKYETALTTGLDYLVPRHIKNIIDLGGKGIDSSTFAVILQELDIPLGVLDNISNYYIQDIVQNTVKLHLQAQRNYTIRKNMAAILHAISEGILAFDKQKRVIFINKAAQAILRLSHEQAVLKNLSNIFPQGNLLQGDFADAAEKILTINGSAYLINTFELPGEVIESAESMITLMPVDTVKELDIKVRREMRKQGNFAYYRFEDIIGSSANLLGAMELAKNFATTNLNILLEGESGVGKEVFAQSIHHASTRSSGPFVAANFASIPTNLVESELFGYEEGAFTGARKGGKRGLFEEAHLGTIFLDEIDSAPKDVQNRLLRVIEEKELRRVGSNTIVPVNVRIIAATNVDLHEQVRKGEFRLDLFYRLCAVPITIPPLRARENDILLMVRHFSQVNYGRELKMTPDLEQFIQGYGWPGNVRELSNFVHYLCNLKLHGQAADVRHLPKYMAQLQAAPPAQPPDYFGPLVADAALMNNLKNLLQELEKNRLLNITMGRYKLLEKLKQKQPELTEYRLKYYLSLLMKNNLIQIGSTKQGTCITPAGSAYLQQLQ